MAAAFLWYEQRILMMKRAKTRELAPGLWAPVGGHLENDELNNPQAGCLREIWEETGITGDQLKEFLLKYIILRRKEDEIRVQYVFFGESGAERIHQTQEGDLSWIPQDQIMDLPMPVTTRFLLDHYFKTGYSGREVYIGSLSGKDQPEVAWTVVADWEKERVL